MSNLIAKPVVKNKFWIVERDNGKKVATIQAAADGVVFVNNDRREKFPTVKSLGAKYNIKFDRIPKSATPNKEIYGFTVSGSMFNPMYDVKRKLPIYTKTAKSKSYYCAGYYLIQIGHEWVEAYCPKLITLNRYKYVGPFTSKEELNNYKGSQ